MDSVLPLLGDDIDTAAFTVKHDLAVDQCEQCVIFALANTFSSVELGANLTNKDVTSADGFATKLLDSTSLSVRIATVSAGALPFLMCHQYHLGVFSVF